MTRAATWITLLCIACGAPVEPSDEDTASGLDGEDATVRNAPPRCEAGEYLAPVLPDEAGFFAAARLHPNAYPVTLTEVRYGLAQVDGCDASLTHTVRVFVVHDGELPADPTAADGDRTEVITVAPTGPGMLEIPVALDPAIVLRAGDELVVAIGLPASDDGARSLCAATCADGGGTPGANWWSSAADAPFDWADLTKLGVNADLRVFATGVYGG